MTQPTMSTRSPQALKLEYPFPVATYDTYEAAQKAVDFLADKQFPVENLAIVGTDLRQYERVIGRRTWGSVLLAGAVSGLMSGLMIAFMLWLLQLTLDFTTAVLVGILLGVLFGVVSAAISQAMSRGERDFNSITQTFAKSYELLCEHKVAQQARDVLAQLPGAGPVPAPAPPAPASTIPTYTDHPPYGAAGTSDPTDPSGEPRQ